jgi:hypothetical protein
MEQSSIRHRRQQSVPQSGVRDASSCAIGVLGDLAVKSFSDQSESVARKF